MDTYIVCAPISKWVANNRFDTRLNQVYRYFQSELETRRFVTYIATFTKENRIISSPFVQSFYPEIIVNDKRT